MEIKSHNSRSGSIARELFIPSLVQVVMYALTSVVFLTVANTRAIWDYLNNDPVGRQYSSDVFGDGSSNAILGGSLQGRIGQVIVWGLIGVLIYTVIWFLKNIVTNLRNDVVADEYVHPHSYNRSKYWKSIAIRKTFFVSLVVVLAGYVYLGVKLIPIFSSYFLNAFLDFNTRSLLYGLCAIAAMTVLLHIFVALTRLTINSWQFIHADL